MKTIEYVKSHINEFEQDYFIDRRFTKCFIEFIPVNEWGDFGFKFTGGDAPAVKEWTEENILEQLKRDVEFGYEKAVYKRVISSELMAQVVNAWCKILENGLDLNGDDGWYHHRQFEVVAKHYGWQLPSPYEVDK